MERLLHFVETNPTVAVSIFAVFFSLLFTFLGTCATLWFSSKNLDKQLNVQLATTVEKEWIKDMRSYLSTFVYHALYFSQKIVANQDISDERREEFISSLASVRLLLDINKPLERKLLQEIESLGATLKKVQHENIAEVNNVNSQIENVIQSAHKIFDSMNKVAPTKGCNSSL